MIDKILGSNVRSDFRREGAVGQMPSTDFTDATDMSENLRNLWMKLDSFARLLVGFGASRYLEANLFW